VKVRAVDGNSPTIFLQQHLKSATLISWKAAPLYEQMLKMFASGEVDAYAGNRARLVEAADTYPGLRVVEDNFTVLEQNLVAPNRILAARAPLGAIADDDLLRCTAPAAIH
jgi:hypothetical protein